MGFRPAIAGSIVSGNCPRLLGPYHKFPGLSISMNRPLKQPYQLIGTLLRYPQDPRRVTNGSRSAVVESDWLRHVSIINLHANAAIPVAFLTPDTRHPTPAFGSRRSRNQRRHSERSRRVEPVGADGGGWGLEKGCGLCWRGLYLGRQPSSMAGPQQCKSLWKRKYYNGRKEGVLLAPRRYPPWQIGSNSFGKSNPIRN